MEDYTNQSLNALENGTIVNNFNDPNDVIDYLKKYKDNEKKGIIDDKYPYKRTLEELLMGLFEISEVPEISDKNGKKKCASYLYKKLYELDIHLLRLNIKFGLEDNEKNFLINNNIVNSDAEENDFIDAYYYMYINKDINNISQYAKTLLNKDVKQKLINNNWKLKKGLQLSYDSDDEIFAKVLGQLLLDQPQQILNLIGAKNIWLKIIDEGTVKKWFSGKTQNLSKRETAIKISFVMGLSYDQTKAFLNRCGFTLFNPRNALDAVYIYCLNNNRSFYDSQEIYHFFKKGTENYEDYDSIDYSGQKPLNEVLLSNDSDITNSFFYSLEAPEFWRDDEHFLNLFMYPNYNEFINFSKTTMEAYYKLKNPLFFKVLIDNILLEEENTKDYLITQYDNKHTKAKKKNIPDDIRFTLRMKNYLKNNKNKNDVFKEAFNKMVFKAYKKGGNTVTESNIYDLVRFLENESIHKEKDLLFQRDISVMLNEVVKPYGFLSYCLNSIAGAEKEWKYKSLKKSELYHSILENYPDRFFYNKYDNEPWEYTNSITLRKAIVLLYFMKYSLDLHDEESNETQVFSYPIFHQGLNKLLNKLHFNPIYPPNRFDFLICLCIRIFEINIDQGEDVFNSLNTYDDNPLDLFNSILKASFSLDDF